MNYFNQNQLRSQPSSNHDKCNHNDEEQRHVHFLQSATTENDGHRHRFRVATLINDPIADEEM